MVKKKRFQTIKKLFPYVKPFIGQNILSLLLIQISTLLSLATPLLLKYFIDDVLPARDLGMLTNFGLVFTGVVVASTLFGLGSTILYANLSEKITIYAREKLFTKLIYYKMSFFDRIQIGDLVARLRDDVGYIHTLVSYVVNTILNNLLKVVFVLFVLWRMNYQMTLILIASIPIYLFINKYFGSKVQKQVTIYRSYISKIMTFFYDVLNKVFLVKNYHYESPLVSEHKELSEKMKKISVKTETTGYLAHSLTSMVILLTTGLILWISGYLVYKGEALTIGEVVAFFTYLNQIFPPVRELASSNIHIKRSMVSINRFFEYIDLDTTYQEDISDSNSDFAETYQVKGNIKFDKVSLAYKDEPILKDLSLEIKSGEKVIIYGRSGSGKSSLVKLLKQFYAINEGDILLDGTSLQNYPLGLIRGQIGYLPQESQLLEGTIADSLRLGKQDATEAEMWAALKIAHLDEFIRSLPEKLDTPFSNNASTMSGGQKQRMAIARLVLQNPKIVIFDEAFANIDVASQEIIFDNFQEWYQEKTVIFISHEWLDPKYFNAKYFLDAEGNIQIADKPLQVLLAN